MNWQQWKEKYSKQIQHIAGYEEAFVDNILTKIPNLQPSDVVPQYHFLDKMGKNRYVDFMIINPAKNWLLPIELDGYAKMVGNGEEYHRFQDFLVRQNAMVQQFGLVLRYTNKAMFNQSYMIIKEIADVLNRQTEAKSTQDIQAANTRQMIQDYEAKIAQLQNQMNQQSNGQMNEQMMAVLSEMRTEISLLKQSQSTEQPPVLTKNKANHKMIWVVLGVVILALLIGLTMNFSGKKSKSSSVNNSFSQNADSATASEPAPISKTLEIEDKSATESNHKQYTVGEIANVCGVVSEVKYNADNGNNYLNINGKFPNQEITFTVWITDDLSYYTNKTVCTYGEIKQYKGRLSINVNSLKGLKEK
ncbi:hypothetical protein [Moraxella marmotae]|uniref:hypothetical protein n=1 Tax=Moraxella marmotae TaxID=3344520 RepID=UPI0035F3CD50